MATAQYFKDTSLLLRKSYRYALAGQAEPDDIRRSLDLSDVALHTANAFSRTDLSVPGKQKLLASVALIKSRLRLLKEHRVGAGLAVPEQSATVRGGEVNPVVKWEDLESAFENRIKTGMITNHKHLDIPTFIRDVEKQFVTRVRESLEVHHAVKVSAVLAAEYVIVKDDKETVDIKYFNTKAMPIKFYYGLERVVCDECAAVYSHEHGRISRARVWLVTAIDFALDLEH